MNQLAPIHSPAQALSISPENLEVANCYLETQDMRLTASKLGIPTDQISEILDRREIRSYIDSIFRDVGFNNRFRIRSVLDVVIQKKLEEMDEAEVGSSKDIAELIALSHKMSMEVLDREIALEKARSANTGKIKNQINVQMNDLGGPPTKYGSLMTQLLNTQK
jgi:hypothetical protein